MTGARGEAVEPFLELPFFAEAHRALAASLASLADEVAHLAEPEPASAAACAEVSRRLTAALGRHGLLAHAVPARDGGAAAAHGRADSVDVRTLCLLREALAASSGLADLVVAMQALGSTPIALAGSEALRRRYLPRVASGDAIAAFALTEEQAGSDAAAVATRAHRDGDAYVLRGEKRFISNAGIAHFYVVFARTSDEGHRGLGAFVVDASTPGLRVEETLELMAPHPIGTVRFEDCRVPAAARLGAEGEGFRLAMATLDLLRPTVGAAALGFGRRALEATLERVRSRRQFGKTLAEQQAVQFKLADMALALESARLLVYRAAWLKDQGAAHITREASMAKLAATEAAARVIDDAVQLHGGLGVVRGQVVERLYREERALRIYEGTSEIQRLVIAGQLLRAQERAGGPP